MVKLKGDWSKAYMIRPRDHIQSHVLINDKNTFKVSYANDTSPATLKTLIGWEYSRRWLEERDAYIRARTEKAKFFRNDYQSWLEKRKPRVAQTLEK